MPDLDDIPFRSKEVSWLSFNARVLQEARDPATPLQERMRFLGIYSNNLDEFFRVRVATLNRLVTLGAVYRKLGIPNPRVTLAKVQEIVARQSVLFNRIYHETLADLARRGVAVITEKEVPDDLEDFVRKYFHVRVKPHLMPVLIRTYTALEDLRDEYMYLAVRLTRSKGSVRPVHALVEIPPDLPRFVVLPGGGKKKRQLVMYLDDIIRFGFSDLFESLSYDQFEAYAVKFTRDAEMQFDDDFTESTYEKVSEGLRSRLTGHPVRINYDAGIPANFLKLLQKKLGIQQDGTLFPGARYHNRRDLMRFPELGKASWSFPRVDPLPHPRIIPGEIFKSIRQNDILLHFPYHSFDNFLDLLREAALDPLVRVIKITHYRVAASSGVASALISAVKNGKEVVVCIEPQARFDERANIQWADRLQSAGIRVLLGIQGLKVHSKACLIQRSEPGGIRNYACVGTGNFNEDTARYYTDHLLLTSDRRIAHDVKALFQFFAKIYQPPRLEHIVIAPFGLRAKIEALITREIENATQGHPAYLYVKINNLSDQRTIALLYRAAAAGVDIRLIVRSMFSVITGIPESKGIRAIGIVDRYLEHSRILICANRNSPEYYISSADFLPRNFDSRVETLCPIFDPQIREDLQNYFQLQWKDSLKGRILDTDLTNQIRKRKSGVRSQHAIYQYLASQPPNGT